MFTANSRQPERGFDLLSIVSLSWPPRSRSDRKSEKGPDVRHLKSAYAKDWDGIAEAAGLNKGDTVRL
jgi:hypothetical protein